MCLSRRIRSCSKRAAAACGSVGTSHKGLKVKLSCALKINTMKMESGGEQEAHDMGTRGAKLNKIDARETQHVWFRTSGKKTQSILGTEKLINPISCLPLRFLVGQHFQNDHVASVACCQNLVALEDTRNRTNFSRLLFENLSPHKVASEHFLVAQGTESLTVMHCCGLHLLTLVVLVTSFLHALAGCASVLGAQVLGSSNRK